jgi:hypothetical protein
MWARVTRNKTMRAIRSKANNIWQVERGCYIWYQSRPHWLSGCVDGFVGLLKGGGLSYPTSTGEGLVADFIKSDGC